MVYNESMRAISSVEVALVLHTKGQKFDPFIAHFGLP
jgi:hypothetical protein